MRPNNQIRSTEITQQTHAPSPTLQGPENHSTSCDAGVSPSAPTVARNSNNDLASALAAAPDRIACHLGLRVCCTFQRPKKGQQTAHSFGKAPRIIWPFLGRRPLDTFAFVTPGGHHRPPHLPPSPPTLFASVALRTDASPVAQPECPVSTEARDDELQKCPKAATTQGTVWKTQERLFESVWIMAKCSSRCVLLHKTSHEESSCVSLSERPRGIATRTSFRRQVARLLISWREVERVAPLEPELIGVGHAIRAATDRAAKATMLSMHCIGAYDHVLRKTMLSKLFGEESLLRQDGVLEHKRRRREAKCVNTKVANRRWSFCWASCWPDRRENTGDSCRIRKVRVWSCFLWCSSVKRSDMPPRGWQTVEVSGRWFEELAQGKSLRFSSSATRSRSRSSAQAQRSPIVSSHRSRTQEEVLQRALARAAKLEATMNAVGDHPRNSLRQEPEASPSATSGEPDHSEFFIGRAKKRVENAHKEVEDAKAKAIAAERVLTSEPNCIARRSNSVMQPSWRKCRGRQRSHHPRCPWTSQPEKAQLRFLVAEPQREREELGSEVLPQKPVRVDDFCAVTPGLVRVDPIFANAPRACASSYARPKSMVATSKCGTEMGLRCSRADSTVLRP